jgi:hypothetical protein
VTKTLGFAARKNPGAGDPTNTIRIADDIGFVTRVESGPVDQWKEWWVGIHPGATWVELVNEDGSALNIRKYPTVNGVELRTILLKYGYFSEYPDYWVTDGLRFKIG